MPFDDLVLDFSILKRVIIAVGVPRFLAPKAKPYVVEVVGYRGSVPLAITACSIVGIDAVNEKSPSFGEAKGCQR